MPFGITFFYWFDLAAVPLAGFSATCVAAGVCLKVWNIIYKAPVILKIVPEDLLTGLPYVPSQKIAESLPFAYTDIVSISVEETLSKSEHTLLTRLLVRCNRLPYHLHQRSLPSGDNFPA